MKKILRLIITIAFCAYAQLGLSQFSIKVGPNFPIGDMSKATWAGNARIGLNVGIQGAIPLVGNTDIKGSMFAITLNANYMWHTLDKDFRESFGSAAKLINMENIKYVNYMYIPVSIGVQYRLNCTEKFAFAIDAACGFNMLYRTTEECEYEKVYQYFRNFKLACGVNASASFNLIFWEHLSIGASYHLLNLFSNKGTSYKKLKSNAEKLSSNDFSEKEKIYPMAISANIGFIF